MSLVFVPKPGFLLISLFFTLSTREEEAAVLNAAAPFFTLKSVGYICAVRQTARRKTGTVLRESITVENEI